MSQIVIYHYPKCSTCKKALKWLDEKGISYTPLHIVEDSPDANTLKILMERSGRPVRTFFNSSGMRYRELGLKEKVGDMTIIEAAQLLASDGMLIKRPLLIREDLVLSGFRPAQWEEL